MNPVCRRVLERVRLLTAALVVVYAFDAAALPPERAVSQYVRRSWTVQEGLPHGTVRGLAQTSDGYLWLATYEGLVRFNGERFRIFDKSDGILNDSILSLLRTRDDSLWLGTSGGLIRFRNGRFETIATKGVLGNDTVYALTETPDGSVWAGTAGGGITRIRNGRVERLDLPLRSRVINALATTTDGTIWIGTAGGGLARYRNGRLDSFTTAQGLANDTVITLLGDGPNSVLAGTAAGLDRIDGDSLRHVAALPADQITALDRDRDGNLWVGTYSNGLFRMSSDAVTPYGISDGLLDPTVRAIFEDDEGTVWVGSNRGLEQFHAGSFVSWNDRHGLSDVFARAVFEDREGTLWAGTAHGLNRLQGNRWTKAADPRLAEAYILSITQSRDGTHWFGTSNGLYRVAAGGATRLYTPADGLSDDSIRAIYEDRNGEVWVATDFGVNRIRKSGEVENLAGQRGLSSDYAVAFAETPDGRLWVATAAGLAEFDGNHFRIHSAPKSLPSNRLFALIADRDGTLWIGTDGDGLVRLQGGKAAVINSRHGLPNDKILSIVDDHQGNLWLGTARGAILVTKKDLNAVADRRAAQLTAHVFDEHDGLGSRQCNGGGTPAAYQTRDGRIWFATANGVSALVGGLPGTSSLPIRKPVIERISIDGRDVTAQRLASIPPGAQRIEFEFAGLAFTAPERLRFRYRLEGYDEKWIASESGRVAAYTNLPAGEYRFVLSSSPDGQDWTSTALRLELRHHFYETWWFLALCAMFVIGLLLAIHFARLHFSRERARLLESLVEERTREISREKERTELALQQAEGARREAERHEKLTEEALAEAEEANRAKSVFLAATSHELRTPLNAIIGFSDILMSRAAEQLDPRHLRFLHNIHSSGEYLLSIINNILDLSKIEAGKMELQPETIVLPELVNGICAVMKGVTTLRRISLELQIPKDLPKFEADPTQLKQILYNLMSNAVKFSSEGSKVTIAARHLWPVDSPLGENAIEIKVIDRGIGIDPKDHALIFQEFRQAAGSRGQRPEGTGLGLALVKRFVEMHRGTVRVESAPGEGSTFFVVLPCRNSPPAATGEPSRGDAAVKA